MELPQAWGVLLSKSSRDGNYVLLIIIPIALLFATEGTVLVKV